MLLLKSRGPGLACITHRKTLGSSQTVQAPAVRPPNPSLLASYKEQSGPAKATSKELSFTPRGPPISSSLSGGKCKCSGVEMLQSQGRGWMEKAVLFEDR